MELAFKTLVIFTMIQRISELFLSKSNEKFIVSKGGKILPEKNYIFMVLLHTTWIIALIYAAFFMKLSFQLEIFISAVILFIMGQFFRLCAIFTLKRRWSTRVMILPEAPVVTNGLFRYLRHPNYLGVVLEIAALPMVAGLWQISIIFSFLNAVILYFRIRFEEHMLTTYNDYEKQFGVKGV